MAPAPGVAEYIVDRSGGNPLFVQGLVAMLREERLLRADEGQWRDVVEELEAPRDIQAVLSARLHHLSVAERAVAERAAVVGMQFTRGAVVELSPPAERSGLGVNLLTLVRKELIVPDPDSPAGNDEGYAFTHALIQEVAYSSMAKETRAELHERYADWLWSKSGGDLAQVDEVVGHHLELAYRNLVDVGRSDERTALLARRAGEALAAAGHRAAVRRDIPGSAVSLLRGAESLLKRNDEIRRTALLDLGDALCDSRSLLEAREVYGKAIEAAEAAHDLRRAMHAGLGILEIKGFLGREGRGVNGAADIVTDALRVFGEIGDNLGLAKGKDPRVRAAGARGPARRPDLAGGPRGAAGAAGRPRDR